MLNSPKSRRVGNFPITFVRAWFTGSMNILGFMYALSFGPITLSLKYVLRTRSSLLSWMTGTVLDVGSQGGGRDAAKAS